MNYFFLTGTVNFNHKSGCQKCIASGIYSKEANRMYFPQKNWPLRTDADFRARSDSKHHKETTPLEELKIDMVQCFPTSDPLHLFELGIMKKYDKMCVFSRKEVLIYFPFKIVINMEVWCCQL